MYFRDVVICDNPACGAILRMSDQPGPISVALQTAAFGTFIVCPRCDRSTLIEPGGMTSGAMPGDAQLPLL